MFLTRISVNHPVFATMIMAAILVFGVFSYHRLPVEQLPDIDLPVVAVVVSYPGASPEAVEEDIVKPIEENVNSLSGIDTIQSTSQAGQAIVIMIFDMEVESSTAAQEVRDRIAQIETNLPAAAGRPQVLRFDPNEMPIISIAVSSDTMSAQDLTTLTEDVIVSRLGNIQGVGRATVVGGVPNEVHILIDPDRLIAYDIGVDAVLNALAQDNQNLPAGSIDEGLIVQTIQVESEIADVEGFRDIIIGRNGGQPVYLGDVAEIRAGIADDESLAFINGVRALAVDVIKIQGANTVGVAKAIHETLDDLVTNELPPGVAVEIVRDTSVPVEQSFHAVINMLVEGAFLAVIIVFLFLNSWRSTIITSLTLPISIIGTMIALNFLGFTLNMMTLMALALSIGILIDDAIVVRENIMRHLHMGKGHREAALQGTKEIGLAVLATSLVIVAVFLPVAFMDGILGRFFLQFGVTVSVAVLISLFVAFTLDPMMSSVWYDPHAHPGARRGPVGQFVGKFDTFFTWITGKYRSVLQWCLGHRKTTLSAAFAIFIGSFFLVPMVGVEFVPAQDTSEFEVAIETPVGSSLEYTATKVNQIERLLHEFDEVDRTYATLNAGRSTGTNAGSILVNMVPPGQRDRTPLDMTLPVREALATVAGVNTIVGTGGGLGGASKPIAINIYGDSLATLGELANQLMARMGEIEGLADIESSLQQAQPLLGIRVNRQAASDLGVSIQQIGATLRPMLAGEEVSTWTNPEGQSLDVIVRLPEYLRDDPEVLGSLPLMQSGATGSQQTIRLHQVAEIVESVGAGEINRSDLSRGAEVTADLAGVQLGDVTGELQAIVNAMEIPLGYRISMGGDAEQLSDTMASAGSALLLAIIFIYLVLASQFGSFLQPIAIMISLPLSLVGVLLGLMVAGSTLNMMSMIGFIMLMGLVVKNAILLVDNANQGVGEGLPLHEALLNAGTTRFRPIVMTSLAMIFGMMPLALSLHEGSGQNASMAHAIIGGMISSSLLTLVVVPVMLIYVDRFGRFVTRFMPKGPDAHHTQPAE